MEYRHTPVLLDKVIAIAEPKAGDKIVDCTLGGAGYSLALAKIAGKGKVLGIDADSLAIKHAEELIKKNKIKNLVLVEGNFKDLSQLALPDFNQADVVVMDLGLSSAQLDDPRRGFSFQGDTPLNMAFAAEEENKTQVIVNHYRAEDLAKIIKEYGEERFAGRIAKNIVKARPLKTTGELVEAIRQAVPAAYRHQKLHFATRTFQALRVATNHELDALTKALPQAFQLLKAGGRLAVVSFHSLEDRIVKNYFRDLAAGCHCPKNAPICICSGKPYAKLLTKKAVIADDGAIKNNPRARSAKLRVLIKL